MVFSSLRHIILLSATVSIIRVYYFRPSPSKRPKYEACCRLHFSLFIIIYCFLAYILPDISILSSGVQVNHLKIHIQSTSSSPCPIRFSTIFSITRSSCPPVFGSAAPFGLIFAPGLLSLLSYYSAGVFLPDKHI